MKKFALLLILASSAPALASSQFASSQSDEDHLLSVGAGISSPSMTSAISENPAGLSNNSSFKLLGEVGSGNSQFNPVGFGGGLFAGNGTVGGGITLQNFNQFENGVTGNSTLLDFGLATDVTALKISLGVSASYLVASSGVVQGPGVNSNYGLNAGFIYNPHGETRLGVTAYGLNDGFDAVGAGLSYDPSRSATLTLDAGYTLSSKSIVAKPGIAIHVSGLQMALGYGFNVQNSGFGWIPTGVSFGLGFPVGQRFAIQAYYNQLALYYGGITISL